MLFIEYFFPRKHPELRARTDIAIRIRHIVIRIQIRESRIRAIIPIAASECDTCYPSSKS